MERYPGCCQLNDVIFNCNATSPPGLVQNFFNEASVLLAASLLARGKAKGVLHKSIFAGIHLYCCILTQSTSLPPMRLIEIQWEKKKLPGEQFVLN